MFSVSRIQLNGISSIPITRRVQPLQMGQDSLGIDADHARRLQSLISQRQDQIPRDQQRLENLKIQLKDAKSDARRKELQDRIRDLEEDIKASEGMIERWQTEIPLLQSQADKVA